MLLIIKVRYRGVDLYGFFALEKRICEERLKLCLTQEKLSEDIDVSSAYIG